MAGIKHPQPHEATSSNKENRAPKKPNRTVSISGLFTNKEDQRQNSKNAARDVLAPKPAGIMKAAASRIGFRSQRTRSKRAENNPLYRSFAESVNIYRQGTTDFVEEQLEPICQELLARVDGLAINGQPCAAQGQLSDAEINELVSKEAKLSKPLEDEIITIQRRKKDGTVQATELNLGTMMLNLANLVEQKHAENKELQKRIRDVDVEIAAAYQAILDTENGEVKKARLELNSDLDKLAREALVAKEQTFADIEQAREDEKAAAAEEKRKLSALLSS